MNAELKRQWEMLQRGEPGRRFQARYEASRRQRSRGTLIGRVVRWVLAAVAIAIGVVLMFIPGPAVVFFALAGALLASESRGVARFLDWSEVKLRLLLKRAQRIWARLPLVAKIAVVMVGAASGAASSYLAWRLMAG
ncbi:MAG TPA: hypothetical protein VEQ65_00555 [Opitutus sp.]|nr:hypothetical protein [Opitutus sp.]